MSEHAPPVFAAFTAGSFALHRGWLQGEAGGRQFEVRNKELPRRQARGENLTRAIFDKVILDGGNFGFARLDNASLVDVRAEAAIFDSVSFVESTLERCGFIGSSMTRLKLGGAKLVGCDFGNAELEWSSWYRAQVTRCTFVGARLHTAGLDHATFIDCDFRGANFAVVRDDQFGTSFEATFVRCDLRGSSWVDRPLHRASFIDCKFYGVRGAPYRSETVIERPDLSERGDGSLIGSDREVYAMWGIDPEVPQRRYTRRSWLLTAEKRATVVAILDARGVPYQEMGLRDSPQYAIEIRDPVDSPITPEITAALEAITEREKLAAVTPEHRSLAQRIIGECDDRGATFDDTVATLMRCGFTREEAMSAMSNRAKPV